MNRAAIRSILVAGDGIVGLSTALAFHRALPGVEVSLLSVPAEQSAVADHSPATLPMVGRFHAAIGLDELDLVRRGIAVHHLGTRFCGPDGPWIHSFGEVGRGEGSVPFRQIWTAARNGPGALAYDRYCPASVIGGAGKFVHPSPDPTSMLATYVYGLRLNPKRYRDLLKAETEHLPQFAGVIAAVVRGDVGGIAELALADGRRVDADLYIDCTGPAAILVGALSDDYDDWSVGLPALHVATEWGEPLPLDPLDHIDSIDGGWALTATVPGAVLRTSVTTRETPGSVAIRPGRRRRSFIANVVAFGDAAVALDPLLGSNLSLAHSAILRAIALLPGRDCNPVELAEFNRLTVLETDRARDFHGLFQSQLGGVLTPSEDLARTLGQWRARGRLPFFEEETFTESSWSQMLIGLGILPDEVTTLARAIDPDSAAPAMAALALELEALSERLPPYADYLERLAGAPARRGQP